MLITFFTDNGSFIKEIDNDSTSIFLDYSDCIGTITGFDVDGLLQKKFNPIYKTIDMTLELKLPNALPEIKKRVENEKLLVTVSSYESLPMLLGRVETETGKRMLENRLKNSV